MSACCCASLHLGFEQKQDRAQSLANSCTAPSARGEGGCQTRPLSLPTACYTFCPGDMRLSLVPAGLQHWILHQTAHAAAADSKSPRQRASLHQMLQRMLQHAFLALLLLKFNTQETSFSASSLQPWKQHLQQSHSLQRLRCPLVCRNQGILPRARRRHPGKEGFVGPAVSGGRGGKASHCS